MRFKLWTQKQYPKKIHCGDQTYAVVFRKNLNCYGITCSKKKTITIKDGLPPRVLLTTFIHELVHVIEFAKGRKIKHRRVYEWEQDLFELVFDNFLEAK